MIPHIPAQRQQKLSASKPFNDLVGYIIENKNQEPHLFSNKFSDVLTYATVPVDKQTNEEKCIAIRTHGIADISTASIQMDAVASQNTRCIDPTFHFILSWPEHEHPQPESIFDAAEHAIKSLGLADHQYVLAIHGNTDNIHCHAAVNRINPTTFRSKNIEWSKKTLHMAARQSEIKHGWTHDNGIYIVQVDDLNKKRIVLNEDRANTNVAPHAHRGQDVSLPSWHDPDSLDSWLKKDVAHALKRALPGLDSWMALHAWLDKHDISLSDVGGGGMRLHATSAETGEVIDLPSSKGLRILKRDELETRWGSFTNRTSIACIAPDLFHLTQQQLAKGVERFLESSFDQEIPSQHIILANDTKENEVEKLAERVCDLTHLPSGDLDGKQQDAQLLLPETIQGPMKNLEAGQDANLRRSETSETSSKSPRSQNRDNSKRGERKEQRAAARLDLRQRFSQYQRFVRISHTGYHQHTKEIKTERSNAIKSIREEAKAAKFKLAHALDLSASIRLLAGAAIHGESVRRKLQAESTFQVKNHTLQAARLLPLGWREWLYEQANLGDQAALAALRGIVYQAHRDAKYKNDIDATDDLEEKEDDSADAREKQYRKLMARLLDEEQKEIAIRSAHINTMRPFEACALLARHIGIQYRVTGNGNIEYSDENSNQHLFTDRGNRITFDRIHVPDEEIRLALIHAQQKFGNKLTLTGNDHVFSERMARLADDMGMTILNPDLQPAIAAHRDNRKQQSIEVVTITPTEIKREPILQQQEPITTATSKGLIIDTQSQTPMERLRAKVLAIDPRAEFTIADTSNNHRRYSGYVSATLDASETDTPVFAQHTGRSVYVVHETTVPDNINDVLVEVIYKANAAHITILNKEKGKGRND